MQLQVNCHNVLKFRSQVFFFIPLQKKKIYIRTLFEKM